MPDFPFEPSTSLGRPLRSYLKISVSIILRLREGKLRNCVSIPGVDKRFFSSLKHQERLLLPESLQYLEYRVIFLQEKSGCPVENDYSHPPNF